jgi:hypothetical protein
MSAEKKTEKPIPDDCFAMIRVPVSLTALAGFVKVASKLSRDCVMRQEGDWMLILHAPKKEVLP